MRRKTGLALLLGACASLCLSAPSIAATIENSNTNASLTLGFYELGQSFTAIDAELLSIGFLMRTANPQTENSDFTIKLFEGEGAGGALIASRSGAAPLDLPTDFHFADFVDFNFSGVTLIPGQQYTAFVSSTFYRLAVNADLADSYGSGQAYISGSPPLREAYSHCQTGGCDTGFRVVGATAAVPEPATWALLISGFGLAGATLRQRRQRRA